MKALPKNIGILHFVGIGGIGMSGIAEILHNLGYQVQGSDLSENVNVIRLRDMGIRCFIGQAAENIAEAQVVVISSAVREDNPEVVEARRRYLPVVRRAEMLAELMRLKNSIAVGGTHGKTTTTSMIAALLDAAALDATVINGGIINTYGTNARLGKGDLMVVEADESDGTFIKLPATMAVVTNIDAEHLDFYGSFDKVKDAFAQFVQNIPFYGAAALCIDHAEVQALISRIGDRKLITFGFSAQADVRATDLRPSAEGIHFNITIQDRSAEAQLHIENVFLPMVGDHNVRNALAAVAICHHLGLSASLIRKGLSRFSGVKRRFTITGKVADMVIVDDYGHHPVEISATLQAARSRAENRVIAVVQPHRYSRLQSLFEEFCTCFNDADRVIVADVYPAGEAPIEGVDRHALAEGLRHHGHRDVVELSGPEALASLIQADGQSGDIVVCLGAGNITQWAYQLPQEIQKLCDEAA